MCMLCVFLQDLYKEDSSLLEELLPPISELVEAVREVETDYSLAGLCVTICTTIDL